MEFRRVLFRSAAKLDRLLPRPRHGKGGIGGIEQVMSFVEHQPGGRAAGFATARGEKHHQRMIGDDQIGMFRGAGRPLDEAAAKMRASGIDALAAPVGERVRPRSEEHTSELQSLMRISYAVFCLK